MDLRRETSVNSYQRNLPEDRAMVVTCYLLGALGIAASVIVSIVAMLR